MYFYICHNFFHFGGIRCWSAGLNAQERFISARQKFCPPEIRQYRQSKNIAPRNSQRRLRRLARPSLHPGELHPSWRFGSANFQEDFYFNQGIEQKTARWRNQVPDWKQTPWSGPQKTFQGQIQCHLLLLGQKNDGQTNQPSPAFKNFHSLANRRDIAWPTKRWLSS